MTQTKADSKFTPGPWEVEEVGVDELFIVKPDGKGGWWGIAELSVDGAFADAHLIAAAPELLEAAKDVEESLRHVVEEAKTFRNPQPWKTEMREERCMKLRAAIAKAEGSGL